MIYPSILKKYLQNLTKKYLDEHSRRSRDSQIELGFVTSNYDLKERFLIVMFNIKCRLNKSKINIKHSYCIHNH